MAIELIDKIKQKNNGTFKLVDAIDVEMKDGTDVETSVDKIKNDTVDISNKLNQHIENHPEGVGGRCDVYVGEDPPIEEYEVWIDTSDVEEITSSFPDSLIQEIRVIISGLNEEVKNLKNKLIEHETRIEYLERYGGGGSLPEDDSTTLIFEDGSIMTFEDGSVMIFEGEDSPPIISNVMLFEDNSKMLFEDNNIMTFE